MTIDQRPDHGTVGRYRDYHCRCDTCRAAKNNYERARRRAILTAEHAASGARPPRCLCDTCRRDRERRKPAGRRGRGAGHGVSARYRSGCRCGPCTQANARHLRGDEPTTPAVVEPETEPGVYPHEAFARYPARPNVVMTSPKAVVCCDREAIENEGAGHDEWCPTRSRRKRAA